MNMLNRRSFIWVACSIAVVFGGSVFVTDMFRSKKGATSMEVKSRTTPADAHVVFLSYELSGTPDDSIDVDQIHTVSHVRRRQVILLTIPKEIAIRILPSDPSILTDNVSFELMMTESGVYAFPQGLSELTFGGGSTATGIRIKLLDVTMLAPSSSVRKYSGHLDVSVLPDKEYRTNLDATITTRPDPDGGTGIDAVSASVNWTGPFVVPVENRPR